MNTGEYVLITPARNEAAHIEQLLNSVLQQTILPKKWVVVSDASTDETDSIVRKYAQKYSLISYVRREADTGRNFASKVYAVQHGWKHLQDDGYEFIGVVDCDVVVDTDFVERLLAHFMQDPQLGVAGGWKYEQKGGTLVPRGINRKWAVTGAFQMFRRACFEAIGGFIPLEWGGEDTVACVMARMCGWRVEAFSELPIRHVRSTGFASGSVLKTRIREGRMDHAIGYHFLYELLKCVRRLSEFPFFIGSCLSFMGYCYYLLQRAPILVPPEVVNYMKKEQMATLKTAFSRARRGILE